MDIPTIPGAVYTISSATSCDVTDKASGQLLGTAEAGSPFTTPAYSDALTLSDPAALYVQIKTFNFALVALGLLGGGTSTGSALPSGYLDAEFLESTGTQWFGVPDGYSANVRFGFSFYPTSLVDMNYIAGRNENYYLRVLLTNDTIGLSVIPYSTIVGFSPPVQAVYHVDADTVSQVATITKDGESQTRQVPKNTRGNKSLVFFAGQTAAQTTVDKANYRGKARIWDAYIYEDGEKTHDFVACVDKAGTPCMYNVVSRQPFYNKGTGSFIVGMNMEQARKLGKLPAGTKLTISLPVGYDSDAGVMSALSAAEANGCVLTVQTYEAEVGAASTFALRRIWVRRTADENGAYVDTAGTRWQVDWCVDMLTPDGSTPDQHGYELFRSVAAAVSFWKIEPYVVPEEELLTEHNENE